jgi:Zn-dependent protease
MKNPLSLRPGDKITKIGHIFETPLVVKGLTWLPVIPLITWLVMSWLAGRGRPDRSWAKRAGVAALTMPALLGSEWCHNLAHAATAHASGKPMDAMRIAWGMPLCVYYDINDASVTPRQHILRSLGGPIFNLLVVPVALLLRRFTRPGTGAREAADVAVGMNIFLSTVSLLPLPGIDGGPILKWSLVERGLTIPQADEAVRKVDGVAAAALSAGSAVAFKNRRGWIGGLLAMFAILAFAISRGLIKE